MPWLQSREKTVYVPIIGLDERSRAQRWSDPAYLSQVADLQNNKVFLSEVLNALSEVRKAADTAETPEELKGCQKGIHMLRDLLTAPQHAVDLLKKIKEYEKIQEVEDNSDAF